MNKVKIIAEVGNTHEGSVGLAKQFIKVAAGCGVDAVKFQTHIFEAESLSSAPNPPYFTGESRKEYFERTAFSLSQYRLLKKYAEEECGVEFFSSPFSIEAVDLLVELGVKTIKIPSGEVNNIPMLEHIANITDATVILSSGMSSWKELDEAYNVFQSKSNQLIILQCTSEYPCLPENAGLNVMQEIKERYHCEVGFSDHTLGLGVSIAAVVLGATVIEKHFTLSKLMYGSDAINSTEPGDFDLLVRNIRSAETALHSPVEKDVKVSQLREMKKIFEKSIVIKHNMQAGHSISISDLCFKKPGDGIPANQYHEVLGKKLKHAIHANEKLTWDNLV